MTRPEQIACYVLDPEGVDNPDARIREDAFVDGDDAEELFEDLEQRYGYTAWRENMYDFFLSEGECHVWSRFKHWLFNRKRALPSLTIRDVATCAAANIPLQPSTNTRSK